MTLPRELDRERLASIIDNEQAIMAYVGELSSRLADADAELEALRRVDRAARAYISGELRAVSPEESHRRWEILVDAVDQVPGDGRDG